ncbi:MAG: hypothetical protein PQJ60_07315 [Spirochaetales bacterium]|nr:hypothetical protein [Spirochaetales bacterium]
MKKITLLMIFIGSAALYGLPTFSDLAPRLEEKDIERIETKGSCYRESSPEEGLIWLPDHYLGNKINNIYKDFNPGLAVEIVTYVAMEEGVSSDPDFIRQVTNQFLNVSDQKGIVYYSSSRKKEIVLIEDSYTVEGGRRPEEIDDFEFSSVPGTVDLTIYQKDANFGGNYFRYHCELYEEGTLLTTTNETNLTVMRVFTVAKPEENIMAYALIPCEEGLYIYTAVFVNDPPQQERIMGVSVNIKGFFRKRVEKIVEWFSQTFVLR